MAELDEKICKQMDGLVELLTTSGKPVLNAEIMKKFKKFCRTSDGYVQHAFELLMKQLAVKHAEVRLSTFQMIDELFMRSHMFRELLLANFDTFLELAAGTEKRSPLPPPKAAAENLKNSVNRSILLWVEKFGHAYRKLTLGFEFLKNFKKIDFDSIQAQLDLERRQKEETERKLEENRKEKLDKVNKEYSESELEIQLCLTEVENGLQLLMPRPDDFFISLTDGPGTSSKTNSVTSTVTSLETANESNGDGELKQCEKCCEEDKTHCKHKHSHIKNSNCKRSDNSSINDKNSENDEDNETIKYSGTHESENRSDESESEEDGDFEEVDAAQNGRFTQEHGLFDRKFALTIELGHSESRLQETEDNQDLIQGVRDQYILIKTKYLPAVKRWLQILSDISAKEEKVKLMESVKNKLEDAVKKCVELEIAQSKRKKNEDSDSEEDDFEEVPVKEGYEEDIPEHVKMEEVMAATSKAAKSKGKGKRTTKKAKVQTKSTQKKLGIKNVKQMAKDILESQRLLKPDDLDSAVLKSQASSSSQQSAETRDDSEDGIFLSFDSSTVCKVPVNQAATSKTLFNQQSASKSQVKQVPSNSVLVGQGSDVKVCTNTQTSSNSLSSQSQMAEDVIDDENRKKSLLEKAPFVNYGVDLEHWENPEKIKAPVKNRFDNASRFWVPDKEADDQKPGGSEEVASLTRRSFTYAGEFIPVKWKCRAPMGDGRLCERMDRVKCPFHGKIIGRDKDGVPTNTTDTEHLLKQTIKAETAKETEDSSSETDASSSGSKVKGQEKDKGKKKAKKRKYPNLTDIQESNDTSRSRLEAKIFNRSTLRRVNKALDAAAMKKLANKFSNQFNYSLK